MNQNARESLSALMDNESDELELRRVLKTLDASPDDADAWRRYHLARSLMQRDRCLDVSTDLSAGIMQKLQGEPLPEMEKVSAKRPGAFSFAGSAAIAAAVSLMVITGVQFYNGGDNEPAPMAGTSPQSMQGGAGAGAAATLAGANSGASQNIQRPSLVDLPLFQSPANGRGAMTVGATPEAPMFMAPGSRQTMAGRESMMSSDREQARLLQSYLDRHAEGASYRSGDAWMPLLRASGHETLGQR